MNQIWPGKEAQLDLERAAKHCPVAKTLKGNVGENIKFIYP